MGHARSVKCKECGHIFEAYESCGFLACLYRCEKCGEKKDITHEELRVFLNDRGINVKDYGFNDLPQELIDSILGLCECGGRFTKDGPHRCPNCGNVSYDFDEPDGDYIEILWD